MSLNEIILTSCVIFGPPVAFIIGRSVTEAKLHGDAMRKAMTDAALVAVNRATERATQDARTRAIIFAAETFADQFMFTGLEDGECDYAIKMLVGACAIPKEKDDEATA